jgi:hypothetical protein
MPGPKFNTPYFTTDLSNWRPDSAFWANVAAVGMFAGVLWFVNKAYKEKQDLIAASGGRSA